MMEGLRSRIARANALLGREGLWLIAALWVLQLAVVTLRQNLSESEAPGLENFARRLAIAAAGAGLFYLIGLLLAAVPRGRVAVRAALALPLATLFTGVHVVINNFVFFYTGYFAVDGSTDKERVKSLLDPVGIYVSGTYWLWGYLSWTVVVIALAYARELGERDRRVAEAEALARRAQLRALRYQVNPHFLFNALNATAALVTAKETARAEEMLANLADFLRASLDAEPLDDVPLSAELDYARLYLDIEQVRFSDRMRVVFDVPPGLRGALVPNLILQPLFENAVKHGVSPSTEPVTIKVRAAEVNGKLAITVTDDGARPADTPGMGIGLTNIAQRLAARFEGAGGLTAAAGAAGGYAATVTLPLQFNLTEAAE
ncbi:sensor histidine kinase [Sphingoaurantiacus capsulatus]|uniref:Sensor histidine kinase n=1 Tax=Sphingoaurantiacus capsulatus TaxID=1771310 RepID=A0ABV7X7F7_9SPHN